ncbi:hypothetical protein OAQ57_02355 [Candidatus Marinimicrobia bacterium]|jgi:hypothetical protein|nr:hypothetical protein [Candidatus Neomarinimicrobiota bacterium]MDC1032459.1 hypothetical protein [Candidatus Neomarinimicrobiota bacterium]|tara:strand:- start:72 stop:518 length:447 start_codon:yes stop_codon:yes gene_type:complete
MNRNRLELIGFISVIASLVFVGMEISQNTTAVRGSTNQAISDQASELYLTIATDRNLAGLVKKLYDDVPKEDFDSIDEMQLFLTVMTGLRRVENIYLQLEDNILDDRAFDRIGLSFYRSKYGRQIWDENKQFFDRNFVPFFEELLDKK